MKNFVIPLILNLIVFVAGGFVTYLLFTDKPAIVYTLSTPIHTTLDQNSLNRETIQQLTIRNNGTQKAERIVVAASRPMGSYEIKKYVSIDSVYVRQDINQFELIYPSLPPDGQIEILFRNINKPVDQSDLEVKYEKGLAKEALEKDKSNNIYIIIGAAVALVTSIASLVSDRKTSKKYESMLQLRDDILNTHTENQKKYESMLQLKDELRNSHTEVTKLLAEGKAVLKEAIEVREETKAMKKNNLNK